MLPSDDELRELARVQYASDGYIEIDHLAPISRGADGSEGAYVEAWVWVEYPEHEEEG